MGLMEQFSDPQYIGNLTTGEKLAGAGITTLMGMGITFIVLALLWAIIAIMTKIMRSTEKSAAPAAAAAGSAAAPAAAATTGAGSSPAAANNTGDLVAVITAAIAASEGTSASNLIVRKITRLSNQSTPWGNAGRQDCIESRKF